MIPHMMDAFRLSQVARLDRSPLTSSIPEASLDADRRMLIDFIHHRQDDCDAAAARLAQSHRHEDRSLGAEWLKMRAAEAQP